MKTTFIIFGVLIVVVGIYYAYRYIATRPGYPLSKFEASIFGLPYAQQDPNYLPK